MINQTCCINFQELYTQHTAQSYINASTSQPIMQLKSDWQHQTGAELIKYDETGQRTKIQHRSVISNGIPLELKN